MNCVGLVLISFITINRTEHTIYGCGCCCCWDYRSTSRGAIFDTLNPFKHWPTSNLDLSQLAHLHIWPTSLGSRLSTWIVCTRHMIRWSPFSCDQRSHHITSHHITSHHITSWHIMAHHGTSWHITQNITSQDSTLHQSWWQVVCKTWRITRAARMDILWPI